MSEWPKPKSVHRLGKCGIELKAACFTDDAVDAAVGADGGLANAACIFVAPGFDAAWWESLAAIETPAGSARKHFLAMAR